MISNCNCYHGRGGFAVGVALTWSNFSFFFFSFPSLHPDSKFEYRECFDITTRKKFYPTDIPSFRCTHRKLESNCQKLIKTLLKLLALSLKLPDPDYFIKCCCHLDEPEVANECDFSMIYYPPILSDTLLPPDTVRCAEVSSAAKLIKSENNLKESAILLKWFLKLFSAYRLWNNYFAIPKPSWRTGSKHCYKFYVI